METPIAPRIPDHQLLRRIAVGSYGEVWLAKNVTTGTHRAIKVVHRKAFENARPYDREFTGLQKFEPISRAHDGLMDILHVGRNDADDYFYSVMELADDRRTGQQITPENYTAKTLRSELQQRGRLPLDECLRIAASLALALDHLHRSGLVHRDVKPSNTIFVNGTVKLADIGLVTDVDATRSFVGTDGYLPPEGPGTPQGDLYSLGKVLYEMGTGRDRLDYPELPMDLKDLPDRQGLAELNEVILKACEPDPAKRYRSALEMYADLEHVRNGKSVKRKRLQERRRLFAMRVAILALAFLAVGLGMHFLRQSLAGVPEPAFAEIRGGMVEVSSQLHRVLWTTNLDAVVHRTEVADIDGDSRKEIIVPTDGHGNDSGRLFVFNRDGAVKWQYLAPQHAYYLDGPMVVRDFALIPGNNYSGPKLALACRSWEGNYPSCLITLDSTGKALGTNWHPGHIQLMAVGSETTQSKPKILVEALNNRLRSRFGGSPTTNLHCIFLLDPEKVGGEAPPYERGSRRTHEWYGVFLPPSQVSVAGVHFVDVNQDGKKEICVWTRGVEFIFTFAGKCLKEVRGDDYLEPVEFLLIEPETESSGDTQAPL